VAPGLHGQYTDASIGLSLNNLIKYITVDRRYGTEKYRIVDFKVMNIQVSTKYVIGINDLADFVKLSLLIAVFSLLVISLWISYQTSYGLYFGKEVSIINLTQPSPVLLSKQIAATEKGDVYVAWVDKNSTSGDSDIKFISSNDSGKTFSLGKELSGGDLLSFSPQIAATEKGDVYVAWVDKNSTSGDRDVSLSSSHDRGLDFNNKINPEIDEKRYFRPYLNFSAQDVNQLHSKVYYFDSEKKEIKVDYIFGGRDGTFEDSITNLLPVPSNTSFIKLEMWVHQNPMNVSSYILYDKRALPTTQENLTWTNNNADTQTISLGANGNNTLKVDVSQGNETNWSVISTDFIPYDKLTLSTSISPQIAATEKGDVYVVWIDKNSTYLATNENHQNKFGSKVLLSDANTFTSYPQIAATEKGDVYVVWFERHVGFKEILNKGTIRGETILLSNNTRLSLSPQIASTEKGDLFAIWISKNEMSDGGALTLKRISKSFS